MSTFNSVLSLWVALMVGPAIQAAAAKAFFHHSPNGLFFCVLASPAFTNCSFNVVLSSPT